MTRRVVALTGDLMDRTKITAAFAEAEFVRSADRLVELSGSDRLDIGIVDLTRVADVALLAEVDAERLVGFGPHVDDELLCAAAAVGIEALPRSVFFRRLEAGTL